MTIVDIAAKIRSGKIDLPDYISSLCDRIDLKEPEIHAMVPDTFKRTRVLDDASNLLKKYPEPSSRPPLFGVPVGIKDIFRVNGFPTQCGSELPSELFKGSEATCVSKLKSAGVIVMGKTITTEFAFFEPGPTRNPHNLEHTPGGSSSGSAAGVASGFFPFALGTQTIGSITRPAAYCGIVGFKPSFGKISTSGVIPLSHSADHVGIVCDDLSGIGLFMSVLAEDWQSPDETNGSRQFVLGIPEGPYLAQATDSTIEHFEKQLIKLLDNGYEIKRINSFANIEVLNDSHIRMVAGEMARVHSQWFKKFRHLYRSKTAETIENGQAISDEELEELCSTRLRLREELGQHMESEGIDLWICPSSTDHAPRGLESTGSPIMNLPWTRAGLPTISVPIGTDSFGLPQGLQCVGHYMKDEELVTGAEGLLRAISGGKNS